MFVLITHVRMQFLSVINGTRHNIKPEKPREKPMSQLIKFKGHTYSTKIVMIIVKFLLLRSFIFNTYSFLNIYRLQ